MDYTNDNTRPGFWLRALAKLPDLLVITLIETGVIAMWTVAQVYGVGVWPDTISAIVLILVLTIGYLAYFSAKGRQTLGYKLAGLQVILWQPLKLQKTDEAATLTQDPAFPRYGLTVARSICDLLLLAFMAYILPLAGYLTIAFTKAKRSLPDIVSGTAVRRIASPSYSMLILGAVLAVAVPFAAVFGLLKPYLFQSFYMPSESMAPTIAPDDRFIVNKLYYRLRPMRDGDIVALKMPGTMETNGSSAASADTLYLKRIVGLPGELLRIENGHIYRPGSDRPVEELYVSDDLLRKHEPYSLPDPETERFYNYWVNHPEAFTKAEGMRWIKVPPGAVFVLGDNRNNSNDSHIWGFLPMSLVRGRVTLIFYPRFKAL